MSAVQDYRGPRVEKESMSTTLLIVQILNGLQLGVLLFLIAAGLTLVFGVMDFINLAHGVQYMLGAYLAVAFYALTGHFLSQRSSWRLAAPGTSGSCSNSRCSVISMAATTSTTSSRPSASSFSSTTA